MGLPIVLAGDLAAAEIAYSRLFMGAYKDVVPKWSRVASMSPSTKRIQSYPMAARTARMRKWEGERIIHRPSGYEYRIINDRFELTLAIPLVDFEDEDLGIHNAAIQDMGYQSAMWPDDLVWDALKAGETELSYDGLAFFSNSHALKAGLTIDNLFASTALNADNYAIVRQAMSEWVGEDGRSLGVLPNLLVVPPALEKTALEIVKNRTIVKVYGSNTAAATVDNVYEGTAEVLVVPELATSAGGDDTAWYLLSTQRPVKPLIFQRRTAPRFQMLTEMSDHAVKKDEILYGVRARGAGGYGPFWLAAKAKAGA